MGNTQDRYDSFMIEDPSVGDFRQIENSLHYGESYRLGYPYTVWKAACLYKFAVAGTMASSTDIISNFIEIEQEVISGFILGNEWAVLPMFILKNVGHGQAWHSRYIKYIDEARENPVSDSFHNLITIHSIQV